MKINNLELAALLVQIHLFATLVVPLSRIWTVVNNIEVQLWSNKGNIRSLLEVGTILRNLDLLTRQPNIYISIVQVKSI